MAEPISVAVQHPAETWAALGVLGAGLIALVSVLYNRINKDISDLWDSLNEHKDKDQVQCDTVKRDLSGIGNKVAQTKESLAQFATHNGFINNEIATIEARVDKLEEDFIELKTEHRMCFEDYKKGKK